MAARLPPAPLPRLSGPLRRRGLPGAGGLDRVGPQTPQAPGGNVSTSFLKDLRVFAETASVDCDDMQLVVFLRIISSFGHTDRAHVLGEVVRLLALQEATAAGCAEEAPVRAGPPPADPAPASHTQARTRYASEVDWEAIGGLLGSSALAAPQRVCAFWLQLLSHLDFVDEPPLSVDMAQYQLKLERRMPLPPLTQYSPLDAVRVSLWRACGAQAISWAQVCQTFLLLNVIQDDPSAAVTTMLQQSGAARRGLHADDVGGHVARHLLGFRNSTLESQSTLVTLLTTYVVLRADKVQALLKAERDEVQRETETVHAVFEQRSRPSLSSLMRQTQRGRQAGVSTSQDESFESFVQAVRFPLNTSRNTQRYVYFLKALHRPVEDECDGIDTWAWIQQAVSCPVLRKNIARTSVVKVDVPCIVAVIGFARVIGEPPAAVKQFRLACVDPFMGRQQARMSLTWTMVLRLYFAAHQRPAVRTECWRRVSTQLERLMWDQACTTESLKNVAAHVETHRFDAGNVLALLERSVRSAEERR